MEVKKYSETKERAEYLFANITTISKAEWDEMNRLFRLKAQLDKATKDSRRDVGNYLQILKGDSSI